MALARNLEVSRRSTSPTAKWGRDHLFFWQARRVAPQKWGKTGGGERPAARRLMKLDRKESAESARSGEGHPTASCRWLGRRSEGP